MVTKQFSIRWLFASHLYKCAEVKDTTDPQMSASYLDLYPWNRQRKKLKTKLYDKRDDFTFPIDNFPFICINIPASPAYRVYISQLISSSRACAQYSDFLDWAQLQMTQRLLKEGYIAPMLKSWLQKLYGRHHDLVYCYEISISQMTMDLSISTRHTMVDKTLIRKLKIEQQEPTKTQGINTGAK